MTHPPITDDMVERAALSPFGRLVLDAMSILIRSQYLPGKFDSPESKEHSARLMDDIWKWTSDCAALEAALGGKEE